MNIEPGSIRSSVLVALGVLALLLLLDPNHPFIVDHQAIPGALVTAFAVVTALQIRARTKRPVSSILYGALASAVLLWLLYSNAVANPDGHNLRLALMFWGGVTVIGIGGIVALERADRAPPF